MGHMPYIHVFIIQRQPALVKRIKQDQQDRTLRQCWADILCASTIYLLVLILLCSLKLFHGSPWAGSTIMSAAGLHSWSSISRNLQNIHFFSTVVLNLKSSLRHTSSHVFPKNLRGNSVMALSTQLRLKTQVKKNVTQGRCHKLLWYHMVGIDILLHRYLGYLWGDQRC